MSPLGDVDDWYLELLTHEYTHILHTDHIVGLPALVNRILGKTLAPNQVQPHWLLEGLAVLEESTYTSGGRLRSSMWNMWMRADVLEDNVATLDVFSNVPRRWPQGNIWYLYGSFFLQWIAETYGDQAIREMIDDYARQIVPYAINRSIRRATGRTFEELYRAWVDSMKRSCRAQADAIRARGLMEGQRVTHTGNSMEHPRWIPENAWRGHAGDLLAYVDDGHTTPGDWAPHHRARRARRGPRRPGRSARAHGPHQRPGRDVVPPRRGGRVQRGRRPRQPVLLRRPLRAPHGRAEPGRARWPARAVERRLACARSERVARRDAGRLHDQPSRYDVSDDGRRRPVDQGRPRARAEERAAARAERALRSGLHAAVVARQPARRLQLVDARRVSRRPDRRRDRRLVLRRDARSRHRRRSGLLARQPVALLPLGPGRG